MAANDWQEVAWGRNHLGKGAGCVWYRHTNGLVEILRVGPLDTTKHPIGHALRYVETGEQVAVFHGAGSWGECDALAEKITRLEVV